jgi:hypothetical protein
MRRNFLKLTAATLGGFMTAQIFGIRQSAPSLSRNNVQVYYRVVPGANPSVQPFFQIEGVEYPIFFGPASTSHGQFVTNTFTPSLVGNDVVGTPTYDTRQGLYARVGNLVYISVFIQTIGVHNGTGVAIITGLPYAAVADNVSILPVYLGGYTRVSANAVSVIGNLQASQITLWESLAAATLGVGITSVGNINNGFIQVSGTYSTDDPI